MKDSSQNLIKQTLEGPRNQHPEDRNEDDLITNAQQPEVQFEVAESTTL